MKWKLRLLIVSLTAATAAVYLSLPPSEETPRVSVTGLRERMKAELPPGTPRSQVEAWLSANDLSWSDTTDVKTGRRTGLGGTIRDIYRSWGKKGAEIYFECSFDEQERLISVTV